MEWVNDRAKSAEKRDSLLSWQSAWKTPSTVVAAAFYEVVSMDEKSKVRSSGLTFFIETVSKLAK